MLEWVDGNILVRLHEYACVCVGVSECLPVGIFMLVHILLLELCGWRFEELVSTAPPGVMWVEV